MQNLIFSKQQRSRSVKHNQRLTKFKKEMKYCFSGFIAVADKNEKGLFKIEGFRNKGYLAIRGSRWLYKIEGCSR